MPRHFSDFNFGTGQHNLEIYYDDSAGHAALLALHLRQNLIQQQYCQVQMQVGKFKSLPNISG